MAVKKKSRAPEELNLVNWVGHPFEGVVWPVPSKSNPNKINEVTAGPNGLICTCMQFKFYSRCAHTNHVERLVAGPELQYEDA